MLNDTTEISAIELRKQIKALEAEVALLSQSNPLQHEDDHQTQITLYTKKLELQLAELTYSEKL
ncbi:hypothetical protein [Thalassotalea fusca]